MTFINAKKVLLKDELGNALIPYVENIQTLPVGQIMAVNCGANYVPEGTLPCDGNEYSKEQFKDLWDNYLISNEKEVVINPNVVIGSNCIVEDGVIKANTGEVDNVLFSNYNSTEGIILQFKASEDVQSFQEILHLTETLWISIKEGLLSWSILDNMLSDEIQIQPNDTFFMKITKDSYNSSHCVISKDGQTWISCNSFPASSMSEDFEVSILLGSDGSYHFKGSVNTLNSYYLINETKNYYAYEKMKSLLNTCSYTRYEQDLLTYGQCGMFGVDTINNTFRIPLIKNGTVIQQALTNEELGKCYDAGLPNITGKFSGISSDNGYVLGDAFYNTEESFDGASKGTSDIVLGFDASRCSKVYGNSDTVQMNAVALRYFVVMSNAKINQSKMDWSQWASGLQSKLNSDLSNCSKPYIVEMSNSSMLPSWYKVYSNGWCEQGGLCSYSADTATVALLKHYKTPFYCISLTDYDKNDTGGLASSSGVASRATDTFTITTTSETDGGIYWETKGYIS